LRFAFGAFLKKRFLKASGIIFQGKE